jgi:hypothetical protein
VILAAYPRAGREGPTHAHKQGVKLDDGTIEGDAWGAVRCGAALSGYVIGDSEFDPSDPYACEDCKAAL